MESIRAEFAEVVASIKEAPVAALGNRATESDERIGDDYDESIRLLGVTNESGISLPKTEIGKNPGRYKVIKKGCLVYNPMRINIGSIGVVISEDLEGITSPDYVVFSCNEGLNPEYVFHFLKSEEGQHRIAQKTTGSVRSRVYFERLAEIEIPVPDATVQRRFADLCWMLERLRRSFLRASGFAQDGLDLLRRDAFWRP